MIMLSSCQPVGTIEHDNSESLSFQAYHIPKDTDIISGRRGNGNAKHPGNKNFAMLVRRNLDEYLDGASRVERTLVVANIVDAIKCNGIKFLKLDPKTNRYVELSHEQAHQKVGHAIRDQIKQLGLGSLTTKSKSSTFRSRKTNSCSKKRQRRRQSEDEQGYQQDPSSRHGSASPDAVGSSPLTGKQTRCSSGLQKGTSAKLQVEGPERTTSMGLDPGLSGMIFDLAQNIGKLDPFPDSFIGTGGPVIRLDASIPYPRKFEDPGMVPLLEDWTDIHETPSSSLVLTPLPLNCETQFEADDIDEVRDILELQL